MYHMVLLRSQSLIQNEKNEVTSKEPKDSVIVNMTPMQLRRKQRSIWISLAGLFVLASLILGCICLYKNLLEAQEVRRLE